MLLLLLILAVTRPTHEVTYSCDPTATCGCSTVSATLTKIVGGEGAGPLTWGWAVSLTIDDTFSCGGTILSKWWVISAAHCFRDPGVSPSQVTVYAGSNNVAEGTQVFGVNIIIVHPDYDNETFVNDIALLQLSQSLNMSDPAVAKICIPTFTTAEYPPDNSSLIAIGWGTTTFQGSFPDSLRQVTLQKVPDNSSACASYVEDSSKQFCASVDGLKDTCQGDSGGPLMMFASSNQWILVGIVSNGNGCASPGASGVYTRVVAYLDWLDSISVNPIAAGVSATTNTTNSAISISFHCTYASILCLLALII